MQDQKYPWIKEESNLTKEEWENHQEWFLSFCGDVVGEPIENGQYYKVDARAHKYEY
jgi:hypothetical protein